MGAIVGTLRKNLLPSRLEQDAYGTFFMDATPAAPPQRPPFSWMPIIVVNICTVSSCYHQQKRAYPDGLSSSQSSVPSKMRRARALERVKKERLLKREYWICSSRRIYCNNTYTVVVLLRDEEPIML